MVKRPHIGCGRPISSKDRRSPRPPAHPHSPRPLAPRRQSRGFTLFEILVTLALVALTIVLVGSTLIGSATSATLARLRAQQEAELLRVVSSMRRQIICIASSSATHSPVVGTTGREPHSDWLDIVTSSLMFTRGVGHAEWRIIHNPNEDPYLAYREAPYVGGENLHNHPWIPFSRLITGMQVKFWSNPQYVEGWKRDEVPERIQVFLYYVDSDEPASFMFEATPGIGGTNGSGISTSVPSSGSSPSPAAGASASPATAPSAAPGNSPGSFGGGTSPSGTSPGGITPTTPSGAGPK